MADELTAEVRAKVEGLGRYVDLVYGAAVRQMGGEGRGAEDVTQAVFLVAIRKAQTGGLPEEGRMAGWLLKVTGYAVKKARRAAERRRRHEEAAVRSETAESAVDVQEVRKMLDGALLKLGAVDREVVVRRYLRGEAAGEVAAAVGMREDTARRRIGRALEKLRKILGRHGMMVPAAGLTAFLAAESARAAPAGLMAGAGSGGTAAAIGIAKGAAIMMKMAMAKTAALAAGVVLILGILGVVIAREVAGPKWAEVAAIPISVPEPATAPEVAPATVPADAPGTMTYRAVVRDSEGKPVAGAKVRLEEWDWNRKGTLVEAEAMTQPDGTFALGPVADLPRYGFHGRTIVVDAAGYAWGWWDGRDHHPFDERAVQVISLSKPQQIAGLIVDEQGNPIAGAAVSLTVQHGETTDFFNAGVDEGRGATTDAKGQFTIDRLPADARAFMDVKSPGYVTFNGFQQNAGEPALMAGARDVRTVLQRGGQAKVRLVKGGEAYKKGNVSVSVLEAGKQVEHGLTDAAGEVVFSGLKAGNYTFQAGGPLLGAEGLMVLDTGIVDVKVGGTSNLTLECVPGRMLRGRVVRAGSSVAHTIVTVMRLGTAVEFYGEVGEDGRFATALAPGNYVLWAQGLNGESRLTVDGKQSENLTVDAGKEPIIMEIKLGDVWHGRLVNERGEGVRSFIYGAGERIESRPDGRFEMPSETSAEMAVAWDKERKHGAFFLYGTGTGEHDVKMPEMGEISGRLVMPDGHKPSEVSLSLTVNSGPDVGNIYPEGLWHFKVDEDGGFTVGPVPAGQGTYVGKRNVLGEGEGAEVVVGGEMRISALMRGYEGYSDKAFAITPGDVVDAGDVTMQGGEKLPDSKTWDAVVSGRVVDEKGEPVKGLRVGAGIIKGPTATTDSDGRFELKGMPRGKVTLDTEQRGIYRPEEVAVESPAEKVQIKITPQGWDLVGKPAPELVVDEWVTGDIKGIGDLKGKVVLLVVGLDSRYDRTLEKLKALQDKYAAKGLAVVVVHWRISEPGQGDASLTANDIAVKAKKYGLTVALDASLDRAPKGLPNDSYSRGATERIYGVRDRMDGDVMFLLDRKGILLGAVKGDDVEKQIEEALGK